MKTIENQELLNCRFKNGMMILPFYHSYIQARLNEQKFAGERIVHVSFFKRSLSLLKGLLYCKIKKKNILIFSSTLFNVKEGDLFFNCLHGYYYDLYPDDTLLLEDSDTSYTWRTRDSYKNLSFINTYIELFCIILQKVCHAIAPIHLRDYDILLKEYPNLFTLKKLSKEDYFTKFYAYFIRQLLNKVKPSVILLNCGSYGHTKAIICYVAKKMGIKVIEPQHGVTYKSAGYTTSEFIATSKEYGKYLPDTLFTFGDYWKDFVKWNYEKVPVGYQYLNEYESKAGKQLVEYDFLIISQPMNSEEELKKIQFVKDLSKAFPERKILFRIHPVENYEEQFLIYKECKNLEVSKSTNVLYEDFSKCKHIVGWFSNCLYECLAFKRIPIIVDTNYTRQFFPHDLGVWIKSPDNLKEIDLDDLQNSIDYTKFWSSDFVYKVKKYIDQII